MSARRRDAGDQDSTAPARGFPPFGPRRGGRFASTWWGKAWIEALQDTALDSGRLSRGRTYARTGRVGTITVSPGRIAAPVHGSRSSPYRSVVLIEPLTEDEWERFLDQVASRAGHIAALLDRDMPADLVADAEAVDVRLLPGVGDLEPECTCPDWGHPCKHAAALCYQASWLLDEDPFVLLLMRGRGEQGLLDELQRRNLHRAESADPPASSPAEAEGPGPVRGTPAQQAFDRVPPPLPDPPSVDDLPFGEAAAAPSVDPAPGIDPAALEWLAADAAGRGRHLLLGYTDVPAMLDERQDRVRILATYPHTEMAARLRRTSGSASALNRAARAWEYGGAAGLEVLESAWSPSKQELARARTVLAESWDGDDPPALRVWRNRWTVTGRGRQLRYGRDGRWYPFRREAGEWWPAGPPEQDAAAAFAALSPSEAAGGP